jgi:hypothetical protein
VSGSFVDAFWIEAQRTLPTHCLLFLPMPRDDPAVDNPGSHVDLDPPSGTTTRRKVTEPHNRFS